MQTKKTYLDILRIIAIFMVIHFHFVVILEKTGIFRGFANGEWGCVGTSLFFLISGNCLARNYGEKLNVKNFYIKRWLSIFPAFYICYILVLIGHTVLLQNKVLAGISPWRLIFTVLGIDNYMNFVGIQNAALVGEWYTAIILCIYLLFPILQFLYKKSKVAGTVIVLVLYALNLMFEWGAVPDDAHIITGVAMFWIGMMTYYFEEKLEHMPWFAWSGILLGAVILLLVELPGPQLLRKNIMALLIFMLFMCMGRCIGKYGEIKPISFLSKIEYSIYLCHHTVLYVMYSIYTKTLGEINPVLYYVVCLIATLVFATVIAYVTRWIVEKIKALSARQIS